jgi:hypothetical protein
MGEDRQSPRGEARAGDRSYSRRARRTLIATSISIVLGALGAGGASVSACGGPGNSGQSSIDAGLILEVPWVNGGVPLLDDAGNPRIPVSPIYPAIATGQPDPGSGPVDCTVLDGIETSPGFYDTFEPATQGDAGVPEGGVGVAIAWTGYDDLSWGSFHAPGDITWYSAKPGPYVDCVEPRCDPIQMDNTSVWGVASYPMGGPSCGGVENHWSLHFRGGLFRNWGGGVSSVFTDPRGGCQPDADICPPPAAQAQGATVDSAGLPLGLPDGGPYAQSHAFVDASKYDGVAFWARTGPEGQTAMIVTITDNFTSDRLARQNQKFCRRLKQCFTQCLSGAPCSLVPDNGQSYPAPDAGMIYRCFDPASGPFPGSTPNASSQTDVPALTDLLYPRCGASACTSPTSYIDPDFAYKECRPYTFPAADYSAEYCWSPGDPAPPDREEQCLDGWAAAVDLTLDWQYFTIPWESMHQGGFGKEAPYFNTKAIDTIAFGFIDGWADVYVDNVSFYRNKP